MLNNISQVSRCSDFATARGPGQKVVSYSVFGPFPGDYYKGVLKLIPRVKEAYEGWIMRLYVDLSAKEVKEWACSFACENQHVDLCDISNLPVFANISGSQGRLWRFLVTGDPLVERYIVRDTDMPIIQRELDALNQWVESGKCFHVMRDHPLHGVSMLAGTWGGCNNWQLQLFQNISNNFIIYDVDKKQDQPILWKFMWPEVKKNALAHDSYTCKRFRDSSPFPTKREGFDFVGMRTYRNKFRKDKITKSCPMACRPKDHQDWELC